MTFPANGGHPAHGAASCQDANKQLELGEGRNDPGCAKPARLMRHSRPSKRKEPLPLSYTAVYRPELAVKHGLPAATQTRSFAQVGGLMSYGADGPNVFRKTVLFVAKICLAAAQRIGNVDQRSMLVIIFLSTGVLDVMEVRRAFAREFSKCQIQVNQRFRAGRLVTLCVYFSARCAGPQCGGSSSTVCSVPKPRRRSRNFRKVAVWLLMGSSDP
jgi:hypothetical protein